MQNPDRKQADGASCGFHSAFCIRVPHSGYTAPEWAYVKRSVRRAAVAIAARIVATKTELSKVMQKIRTTESVSMPQRSSAHPDRGTLSEYQTMPQVSATS